MSETVIIQQRAEDMANEIKALLEANLEAQIIEENSYWNDDISITAPDNKDIVIDDMDGYMLLDIGQYPAIFIFPVENQSVDNFSEAYKFEITGVIKEDNYNNIVKKNLRLSETVKAVLKSDLFLNGSTNGGIIGKVNYSAILPMRDCFFIAFSIDISYLGI